jgi:beta-1,4-N-acetylglucosaminyltransferase
VLLSSRLLRRHVASAPGEIDVLLVCSAGGHLLQLRLLRGAWEGQGLRVAWVTLGREDAQTLLAGEDVTLAFGPTTRNVVNLFRNFCLAVRVLRRRRPGTIVTTGAGLAVPFAWVGRMLGVPTVYVESLTRIERASLSCRLILPVADRAYAQWPELAARDKRLRYGGQVIGGS